MSRKLNTKPVVLPADDGEESTAAVPARPGLTAWLPRTRRGWAIATLTACAFLTSAIVAGLSLRLMPAQASAPAAAEMVAGPAVAIDGATVTIAGRTLRLAGIEAPPATLVCRDGAWKYRCGDDARRGLETAIGRKGLDCVVGPAAEATCRNDQAMDVGALQVQNGWAVIDLHRTSRYFVEQARAQQDSRGLWHTDFAHPETWRLAQGDRLY